eukprot:scaffold153_cov70-Phaeocystis_antarctica.AAC.2
MLTRGGIQEGNYGVSRLQLVWVSIHCMVLGLAWLGLAWFWGWSQNDRSCIPEIPSLSSLLQRITFSRLELPHRGPQSLEASRRCAPKQSRLYRA